MVLILLCLFNRAGLNLKLIVHVANEPQSMKCTFRCANIWPSDWEWSTGPCKCVDQPFYYHQQSFSDTVQFLTSSDGQHYQ